MLQTIVVCQNQNTEEKIAATYTFNTTDDKHQTRTVWLCITIMEDKM